HRRDRDVRSSTSALPTFRVLSSNLLCSLSHVLCSLLYPFVFSHLTFGGGRERQETVVTAASKKMIYFRTLHINPVKANVSFATDAFRDDKKASLCPSSFDLCLCL